MTEITKLHLFDRNQPSPLIMIFYNIVHKNLRTRGMKQKVEKSPFLLLRYNEVPKL